MGVSFAHLPAVPGEPSLGEVSDKRADLLTLQEEVVGILRFLMDVRPQAELGLLSVQTLTPVVTSQVVAALEASV